MKKIVVILLSGMAVFVILMLVNPDSKDTPNTSPLPYMCYDKLNSLKLSSPAIYFPDDTSKYIYEAYIFDDTQTDSYNVKEIKNAYRLETYEGIDRDTIDKYMYRVSDSFYKYKPGLEPEKYFIGFKGSNTPVVYEPADVDYKSYLNGYYSIRIEPRYKNSRRMLDLFYVIPSLERMEEHQYGYIRNINRLLKIFYRQTGQNSLPKLSNSTKTDARICIPNAILYFSDSTCNQAYVFSGEIIDMILEDQEQYGNGNYYAVACDFNLDLEKSCNILAKDSNGILARLKPKYQKKTYRLYMNKLNNGYLSAAQEIYASFICIPDHRRKEAPYIGSIDYPEDKFIKINKLIKDYTQKAKHRE